MSMLTNISSLTNFITQYTWVHLEISSFFCWIILCILGSSILSCPIHFHCWQISSSFFMTHICRAFPLCPTFLLLCCIPRRFHFFFFSLSSAPPPYLCRHLFFCCCLPFHCLPAAEQMKQQYNDGFGCWTVAELLFYIAIHSSICICFCCSFFFAATAETPLVPQRIQVP